MIRCCVHWATTCNPYLPYILSGLPKDAVLEVFGEYFLIYCLEHGYDKMLRTLGDNLEAFIQNLDALHELLSMSYKDFDAPSFR